ncbi:MAG: hypothetical protein COV46_03350 [Deltaproteobacteria bacterium CG11_big_fil_rev_8_21_14_0_20_49_13]|nr:MAG: hypothetical protein COV46_03350 [Deltaproteobacteria bacterium CG11_big_fil_rev_8_21_14_0_20_49_13]
MKNEVHVIFGATSGLGWHLASRLFYKGKIICAFGRRLERLQGLRATLCSVQKDNLRLLTFKGDITDAKSVNDFLSQVISKYNRVDRIIICSGKYIRTDVGTSIDLWKDVVNTNFWGTVNVVSSIVNGLKTGAIKNKVRCVAITSSLANKAIGGSTAYSCSKSALQIYINGLASDKQLSTLMLCYAIQPPPFRSEMNNIAQISAGTVAQKIINFFSKETDHCHARVIKI